MPNGYPAQVSNLLQERGIVDMAQIQAQIPDRARISLIRDLRHSDYLTSYNKAGKYYALRSTARFDEHGIWMSDGICFSSHGSLKKTAKHFIDNSGQGYTHKELQQLLHVRVQNTLLDLVNESSIDRVLIEGTFVYTNADAGIRERQLSNRRERNNESKPPFSPYLAIAVLRAVIKNPSRSSEGVLRDLACDGVKASLNEVAEIFTYYGLGKKNSL
jgi:hypothetical protein